MWYRHFTQDVPHCPISAHFFTIYVLQFSTSIKSNVIFTSVKLLIMLVGKVCLLLAYRRRQWRRWWWWWWWWWWCSNITCTNSSIATDLSFLLYTNLLLHNLELWNNIFWHFPRYNEYLWKYTEVIQPSCSG